MNPKVVTKTKTNNKKSKVRGEIMRSVKVEKAQEINVIQYLRQIKPNLKKTTEKNFVKDQESISEVLPSQSTHDMRDYKIKPSDSVNQPELLPSVNKSPVVIMKIHDGQEIPISQEIFLSHCSHLKDKLKVIASNK